MDIQLPQGGASNDVMSGAASANDLAELRKALTSGYATDSAVMVGGRSLQVQSLEQTLIQTVQDNKHFKLFNKLVKANALSSVDEWTEQDDIGGFPGGTANGETSDIIEATGNYERRVEMVKYLMTSAKVSVVQSVSSTIVDSIAIENTNATKRILTDAEHLAFYGDKNVVPEEFPGIVATMEGFGSVDHIVDAEGGNLSGINEVMQASSTIAKYGNFGQPTDIFFSPKVQADFDADLDPAFRINLDNNPAQMMLGAPVVGIRTSHGEIATCNDVFIQDEDRMIPFEAMYPAVATANATRTPVSTVPGVPASDPSSKFKAEHAGNYYYAVAGVDKNGESTLATSSQVAVAAGDKVVLTITASAGGTETGYAVYRGRLNGTNAASDLRLMARIPKGGGTTVYNDYNTDIPGTTKAFVMNLSAGDMALTWRQLLPLTKFDLFPTSQAVIPWAVLMFGYLRIAKRKHVVVIKNIVTKGQSWKPFE